ncbi:MAG: deoxyhypusine synthase family protein [Planctomycetaceae bacterium]
MASRKKSSSKPQAEAPVEGLTSSQHKAKKKILAKPIEQVQVGKGMRAADLVESMSGMSIQARNIGRCAEVLKGMYEDKARPTVLLGLAGPLIAAGLRRVIRDLVVGGYVDVVVSTGAILYQDIYQARGFRHYKGTPAADDVELRSLLIDRIYDTYVDEEKFWETDKWCGRVSDELPAGEYSSRAYLDFLGSKLDDEESIVYQCHKLGVPIFCPAINDSSIGIGLTDAYYRAKQGKRQPFSINSIRDNYELVQIVVQSKKTAAIYVAGGVPKNYINDSIVMGYIFGLDRGHDYALQVTTAVTADGGLSSSTLGEAQSWGKIAGRANFAMAWVEPSVSLPLLAAYAFDRFPAPARPRLKYTWDGDTLASLKTK